MAKLTEQTVRDLHKTAQALTTSLLVESEAGSISQTSLARAHRLRNAAQQATDLTVYLGDLLRIIIRQDFPERECTWCGNSIGGHSDKIMCPEWGSAPAPAPEVKAITCQIRNSAMSGNVNCSKPAHTVCSYPGCDLQLCSDHFQWIKHFHGRA